MSDPDEDWRRLNRANWDERVAVHLGSGGYDLTDLRGGHMSMNAIEERELGTVAGQRVLHLQCHFGRDSLCLAQRGAAAVVGLDFSAPAIEAARGLASELGLASRTGFVRADLYDAKAAIGEAASFDLVYVTWGALIWLPDIAEWARIVAHFLKPGGRLYLAEVHPAALVFDDTTQDPEGRPGWFAPYFHAGPLEIVDDRDSMDPAARLTNTRTHQFIHPIGSVIAALLDAGLKLEWFHEHDAIAWRMFKCQIEGDDGLFRWPDKAWLPLAFSLQARKA